MFERFTERARQVVVLAQQEARAQEVRYIGAEHILMGLLLEGEGLAASVLNHLGVTTEAAREIISTLSKGDKPEGETGQLPFTPRAKTALELALREALGLGHNYIGTEHILLGLVRDKSEATRILDENFGIGATDIKDEVVRMLSGPRAPILRKDKEYVAPEFEPVEEQVIPSDADTENVFNIVAIAVTLGRQYPEASADSIANAAIILNHG
jgi:ATP-dependent Clp protease ATP-binding subunit ClpA